MSTSQEQVVLTAPHHAKLGCLHCGVTREGFIAVAGDVSDIEDGQSVTFARSHVTVERHGKEYTFHHDH